MNTNPTTRIRPSMFAATVAIVASIATASPASASPTREGAGQSGTSAVLGTCAQPLDALGGDTLAQYVQDHQAGDPRTFVKV